MTASQEISIAFEFVRAVLGPYYASTIDSLESKIKDIVKENENLKSLVQSYENSQEKNFKFMREEAKKANLKEIESDDKIARLTLAITQLQNEINGLNLLIEEKGLEAKKYREYDFALEEENSALKKRINSLTRFVENRRDQYNGIAFAKTKETAFCLHEAKHVLILGEEDFSFTKAISTFVKSPHHILATAYEVTNNLLTDKHFENFFQNDNNLRKIDEKIL